MTTPKTKENKKSINDIKTPESINDRLKAKVEINNRMVERKNELLDELNKINTQIDRNLGKIEMLDELRNSENQENGKALETTEK
jgi:hypothetical protein